MKREIEIGTTANARSPSLRIDLQVAFVATFAPGPRWSESIQRHAGARCPWRAIWVIGDGPFRGELACAPFGGFAVGLAWAPLSELQDRAPYDGEEP